MPLKRAIPLALLALSVGSVALAIGLGFELGQGGSDDARERSDILGDAAPSLAPPPARETYIGFAYPSGLTRPPTADESQSKLWFHDGSWWGVLINPDTAASHIYRLEAGARTWADTGVVVDDRVEARSDVLSDGDRLYVATGGASPTTAAEYARLMRFTYDADARTYRLDPRFPVQLTDTGIKRLTIAKDTAGTLWIAYVLDGQVWINHTLRNDSTWAGPQILPTDGPSVPAEQAVILAYGDRVGVVWTNRIESRVSFASHADGDAPDAWTATSTPLGGGLPADNHIEVGSLSGDEGTTVFIVVKTSLDTRDDSVGTDPQMLLLELPPDGEWETYVFGVLRDHHTQPLLLIDEDARELYVFAVAPFGEGTVYLKRTSADEISLPPGAGKAFLHWADGPAITTPTSTKQNVGAASGIVVLATDVTTNQYVHGMLDLAGATEP